MRFHRFAVAATALALGACAGGDNAANNASTTDTAAAVPAPAATPAAATTGVAPAPITGTTYEVKMIGDAQGYRFDPANITVKPGDGIKFVMVSGGPHNVAFDPASVPANVKGQLDANISEKMGELSSAMKMNPNESITVSFGNIPPGSYPFHCIPHLAMGMKGVVTVQ